MSLLRVAPKCAFLSWIGIDATSLDTVSVVLPRSSSRIVWHYTD
jgi:hypothetical protein